MISIYEYNETEVKRNAVETKESVEVAKEEMHKLKPKVRKLSQKLLLEPATEALDESREKPIEVTKKAKKSNQLNKRKLLIIEEDDEK